MQVGSVTNAIAAAAGTNKTASTSGVSFTDVLNDALKNTAETEAEEQQGVLSLLSGEDVDVHTAMIESQKAELALNLTIQIRNKVVDAYKEIMQMQV
ncbi:MAG: flagellar hook-basal body complex protein FliE [Bacillota bacterium]